MLGRVHASQRELARRDARFEIAQHLFRVDAGKRSRLRYGAGSQQLAEQPRGDERHVDREDEAGVVPRRPKARHHAEHRRALLGAVVQNGKRQLVSVLHLPDRDDLLADLAESPPRALGERLPAKRRECLR